MNTIAWSILASSAVIADALTPNKSQEAIMGCAFLFLGSLGMMIYYTVKS